MPEDCKINQLADNSQSWLIWPKAEMSFLIKFGSPVITNDGVTIAKEIELENPFENMGAQLVKRKLPRKQMMWPETVNFTTAILFAQAIIREGLKNVAAKANLWESKKAFFKSDRIFEAESFCKALSRIPFLAQKPSPVSQPFQQKR